MWGGPVSRVTSNTTFKFRFSALSWTREIGDLRSSNSLVAAAATVVDAAVGAGLADAATAADADPPLPPGTKGSEAGLSWVEPAAEEGGGGPLGER